MTNMCLSMTKDSDFFENEIFLPRPKIANVAKWNHVQSQPYAAKYLKNMPSKARPKKLGKK